MVQELALPTDFYAKTLGGFVRISYANSSPSDTVKVMSLWEYRKIDSEFQRQATAQPKNLCPDFFNTDGTATPLLHSISERVDSLWANADGPEMLGKYVIRSYYGGKFWEGLTLNVGILARVDYVDAKNLEKRLNGKRLVKGTGEYKKAKRQYKGGKRDFVHHRVLIAKPHGDVFDLKEKVWITFGKSELHHDQFVRNVLGLDPDLFY